MLHLINFATIQWDHENTILKLCNATLENIEQTFTNQFSLTTKRNIQQITLRLPKENSRKIISNESKHWLRQKNIFHRLPLNFRNTAENQQSHTNHESPQHDCHSQSIVKKSATQDRPNGWAVSWKSVNIFKGYDSLIFNADLEI